MERIQHTIDQHHAKGVCESHLTVTVDYDVDERTVDEVVSIESYNFRKSVFTDITMIMKEQFECALESIISSIPWDEIYSESKALVTH